MSRKTFVNLPVRNLDATMAFWSALDFEFNPQFTDDKAACMVVGEDSYVMLLEQGFYSTFTSKSIVDTATHNEVIVAVSADSRDEVDALVHKALAAGGKPSNDAIEDGPMYGWSFQDVDGHLWELIYMDPSAIEG